MTILGFVINYIFQRRRDLREKEESRFKRELELAEDYKKKGTTDTFSDVKTFEAKMRSTESTSHSRNAMRASGCDCGMMPEEGY